MEVPALGPALVLIALAVVAAVFTDRATRRAAGAWPHSFRREIKRLRPLRIPLGHKAHS